MESAVIDPPESPLPAEGALPVPQVEKAIAANRYLVRVSVSAPTGEAKIQNAKVVKTAADGVEHVVDKEKTTAPRNRYKQLHPIFKQFEVNAREIQAVLDFYSALSPSDGMRQIDGSKLPEAIAKLIVKRTERMALVDDYIAALPELLTKIDAEFPDEDDRQTIKRLLPGTADARERFGLSWTIWPLSPMTPENFDLSNMSEADRIAFIAEGNKEVQRLATEQAKRLVEDVIGSMHAEIEKITSGKLLTGKNRNGALTPVITAIDRLSNFTGLITDHTVLSSLDDAKAKLAHYNRNMKELNGELVRHAVAESLKPLEATIASIKAQKLDEAEAKVDRDIDL